MIARRKPNDESENAALAKLPADFHSLEGLLRFLEHAAWRHSKGFYNASDLRAAATAAGAAVVVHRAIRERDGATPEDTSFEIIPARIRGMVPGADR